MKHTLGRIIGRAASTLTKDVGDSSSVFPSLSGQKPEPLPPRFAAFKKALIQGNEDIVQASWTRLLSDLRREVDELKPLGTNSIPTISYAHVENDTVPRPSIDQVRQRGVGVIRNVLDSNVARDLKVKTEEYIAANRNKVTAFPADNLAVYELYWSPSQVFARSHPHMLKTQSFLSSSLWHSSDSTSTISTTYPVTYADRLRIRLPGDHQFALGPHIDGGSIERWEDPEYPFVYSSILSGHWESYDPYNAKHRVTATMDLYNGVGNCSMFRLFQGWLSMSSTSPGEGTLRVCPLLQHATAYLILRPFFTLRDANHGAFDLDTPDIPGSISTACQEYTPITHPHLELEDTMVSIPHVEPGDYVAWHCDTIHAVDAKHQGHSDSSVLYIPACALTEKNVKFLARQREAAEKWAPPLDFPSAGGVGEREFEGRVEWNGGRVTTDGLRAMGLGRHGWDILSHMSEGEKRAVEFGNRVLFGEK